MLNNSERIDIVAHKKDPFAHHNSHHASSGGIGGTWTVQAHIDQPDLLGTAEIRIIHAHERWAPQGIKILDVKIDTGESSTYSVTYEFRSTTTGSGTTIATVATSASLEAETSVLTNDTLGVGDYLFATLPATDVNWLGIEVNFEVIGG